MNRSQQEINELVEQRDRLLEEVKKPKLDYTPFVGVDTGHDFMFTAISIRGMIDSATEGYVNIMSGNQILTIRPFDISQLDKDENSSLGSEQFIGLVCEVTEKGKFKFGDLIGFMACCVIQSFE